MSKLLIALDFDNTYTADPKLFRKMIKTFQQFGHEVIICTMRCVKKDWDEEFDILFDKYQVSTIFCDGKSKRQVCENLGLNVNIWIDDYPEGIHLGSQYTPGELQTWRDEKQTLRLDTTLKVA